MSKKLFILLFIVLSNTLLVTPYNCSSQTISNDQTQKEQWIARSKLWLTTWQNADGGWGRNANSNSDSISTALAAISLIDAGYPVDSPVLLAAKRYLLETDYKEDFPYFLSIILRALIKFGETESPRTANLTSVLLSYLNERKYQLYEDSIYSIEETLDLAKEGVNINISEIIGSIVNAQDKNGGFGDSTDYNLEIRRTSYALIPLAFWSSNEGVILKAVDFIKNEQNGDGGWGPLPKTQDEELFSDYFLNEQFITTTSVLHALVYGGNVSSQFVQNGLEWLVLNVNPDNRWTDTRKLGTVLDIVALCSTQNSDLAISRGMNSLKVLQTSAGDWVLRLQDKTEQDYDTLTPTLESMNLLLDIGEDPSSPCISRALHWLMTNQTSEGYWDHVPSQLPSDNDSRRILATVDVIDILERCGISPNAGAIIRARSWLLAEIDPGKMYKWGIISLESLFPLSECVKALLKCGEPLASDHIQKAISFYKNEVEGHTFIGYNLMALSFFVQIGEDAESHHVATCISNLLQAQEDAGNWGGWTTSSGTFKGYVPDFYQTYDVLKLLLEAGISAQDRHIQLAKSWLKNTWELNATMKPLFEATMYTWYRDLEVLKFLGDDKSQTEILNLILLEQNTPNNDRMKTERTDAFARIFPYPDYGWPYLFENPFVSIKLYAGLSEFEGTIYALKSLILLRGFEEKTPLVSFEVFFPNEVEVEKPSALIVSANAFDGDYSIDIKVVTTDFNVDAPIKSVTLNKHETENQTFTLLPLSQGNKTLEVQAIYQGRVIERVVMPSLAYVPLSLPYSYLALVLGNVVLACFGLYSFVMTRKLENQLLDSSREKVSEILEIIQGPEQLVYETVESKPQAWISSEELDTLASMIAKVAISNSNACRRPFRKIMRVIDKVLEENIGTGHIANIYQIPNHRYQERIIEKIFEIVRDKVALSPEFEEVKWPWQTFSEGGDCDCKTTLLASMLLHLGTEVKIALIPNMIDEQTRQRIEGHSYVLVFLKGYEKSNGEWIRLDPSDRLCEMAEISAKYVPYESHTITTRASLNDIVLKTRIQTM